MFYKIAQLILTPTQKSSQLGEVYLAQPDAHKEGLAGRLFILIELPANASGGAKFINYLVSELTHNYYQNEKLILRERLSTIKIEHIFEAALAKTNKNLADFMQNPVIDFELRSINATVGVIFENELHFSVIGANKAFLAYLNPKDLDGRDYRITEITGRVDSEPVAPVVATKIFSNVINGQLPEKGYFIFSNEALPEYVSSKQLMEIVTTLSPVSAVEQLKNQLAKVNAYVSFLALIIKNTVGQAANPADRIILSGSSQNSINSLNSTEQATERLLTPSGVIDLKSWIQKITRWRPKLGVSLPRSAKGGQLSISDRVASKKRTGLFWLKKSFQVVLAFFLVLFDLIKGLPQFLKADRWQKSLNSAKQRTASFFLWFKNLERKHQVVIVVVLVTLGFFVENLFTLKQRNYEEALEQNHQDSAKLIEQKETAVESSLIYKNEDGANQILSEIKPLLDQLPADDPQYAELFKKYEQQVAKLRKENKTNPVEAANFAQISPQAKPENLSLIAGQLVAGDAANSAIYRFDLATKSGTIKNDFTDQVSELRLPALDEKSASFLNKDKVIEFDPTTGKAKQFNLEPQGNPIGIANQAIYNGKLYQLNSADRQIYRFNKTSASYSGGSAWLKQPANELAGAVSLSIDSSIFVLVDNGQIYKYLRGEPEPFTTPKIQPPVAKASKLFITDKKILIFEPAAKRIISLDKNGNFINQATFAGLNEPRDAAFSADGSKAYILSGSSAWEINL
ncbi:hypothetical protein HGA34_01620 [Candidatus Falkowbacteria bacterium]|nr:hypothetical protein [Candidatus Falkowbacteria bacterium]